MRNEGAVFLLAVQFLTRLPIGSAQLYTPERMAASVRYYPLVGALIGAFSALVFYLATFVFPAPVAILFAIAAGLLITGAFHEDGLADTFDGIGGGLTRERALEIMKDSRLGTYGTLALVIGLALMFGAHMELPITVVPIALIAGHSLSRLSSILVIATSSYVRDEGTGKPVAGGISATGLFVGGLTGLAVVAFWWASYPPVALLWSGCGLLV